MDSIMIIHQVEPLVAKAPQGRVAGLAIETNVLTIFDIVIEEELPQRVRDRPIIMKVAISAYCHGSDALGFSLMIIGRNQEGVPLAACSITAMMNPTECFEYYSGFVVSENVITSIYDYILILHGGSDPTGAAMIIPTSNDLSSGNF